MVGEAARSLYPDGILIDINPNLNAALENTIKLINNGWHSPIFEATFEYKNVLVRTDIMLRDNEGWRITEVKSAASVKDYYYSDLATQIWVLEGNNIKISEASIYHLNTSFVYQQEENYHGLFTNVPLTKELRELVYHKGQLVSNAQQTLMGKEPEIEIGEHCNSPFACEFQSYCTRKLPEGPDYSVWLLPNASGKKLAREWVEKGIDDLTKIPSDKIANETLKRIHKATVSGKPYLNRKSILNEISDWSYPLHFLDFETIAYPVPKWIGTKPYQQVPFQFSCHSLYEDGTITHNEYLSLDGADPRRDCAERLIGCLCGTNEKAGAIVAYNASFERKCVRDLSATIKDLKKKLNDIESRIVDLLPVVRKYYYHRDQHGSWSIKSVLPTLCPEMDYSNLEVKAGDEAQVAYLEAIDPHTSTERKKAIADALSAYCGRDTMALIEILNKLTS